MTDSTLAPELQKQIGDLFDADVATIVSSAGGPAAVAPILELTELAAGDELSQREIRQRAAHVVSRATVQVAAFQVAAVARRPRGKFKRKRR